MGDLLRCPNGRSLLLIPRSASNCFCNSAISSFWPKLQINKECHPAASLPIQENFDNTQHNVCIIVRNPVERFKSIISHHNLNIKQQLSDPLYKQLPKGNFAKYFRFEDQLQECADWLGITSKLEKVNSSKLKPNLTKQEQEIVEQIYHDDIILWRSLWTDFYGFYQMNNF